MERRGRSRAATRRRARRASPPSRTKTRKPAIPTDCGFFFVSQRFSTFRYHKILKRIPEKCKQKQDFASKFACYFACCLLAIKKPLGSLRAALFISPMIFYLCPSRPRFRPKTDGRTPPKWTLLPLPVFFFVP